MDHIRELLAMTFDIKPSDLPIFMGFAILVLVMFLPWEGWLMRPRMYVRRRWERYMAIRKRREALRVELEDLITDHLENAVADGKWTRKEVNYIYKKMGKLFDLTGLLSPPDKEQLKYEISKRLNSKFYGETPVNLPG